MSQSSAKIGFLSLFNGISTFSGYLMPNQTFENNSTGSILLIARGDKGVQDFPKGIKPKLYGFRYFYLALMIYKELYDFKYLTLILIIDKELYSFKYSDQIQVIIKQ